MEWFKIIGMAAGAIAIISLTISAAIMIYALWIYCRHPEDFDPKETYCILSGGRCIHADDNDQDCISCDVARAHEAKTERNEEE